jgi:hypothetical protein
MPAIMIYPVIITGSGWMVPVNRETGSRENREVVSFSVLHPMTVAAARAVNMMLISRINGCGRTGRGLLWTGRTYKKICKKLFDFFTILRRDFIPKDIGVTQPVDQLHLFLKPGGIPCEYVRIHPEPGAARKSSNCRSRILCIILFRMMELDCTIPV